MGSIAGAALIAGTAFFMRKRYKRGLERRQQQTDIDNEDFYADPYQQNMQWQQQQGYGGVAASAVGYQHAPRLDSDEFDEYGHPRNPSLWSSLKRRFG